MNRRLLTLGSVALLLAAYVLAQGLLDLSRKDAVPDRRADGARPDAPVSAPPAAGGAGQLNPLEHLVAEEFTAILQRPLFNPDRASRPVEAPPPEPVLMEEPPAPPSVPAMTGPVAQDYKLYGVASGPAGRVAAIRIEATGEMLYLREGQPIQAWTIRAVADRSVIIGTEETSVTITLFDGPSAAATESSTEVTLPPMLPRPAALQNEN